MGHDIPARMFEADGSVQMRLTIFTEIMDLALRYAFREYQIISVWRARIRLPCAIGRTDVGCIRDKVNDTPCPGID